MTIRCPGGKPLAHANLTVGGFKSIEACELNKCGAGTAASTAHVNTACKNSTTAVAGQSCRSTADVVCQVPFGIGTVAATINAATCTSPKVFKAFVCEHGTPVGQADSTAGKSGTLGTCEDTDAVDAKKRCASCDNGYYLDYNDTTKESTCKETTIDCPNGKPLARAELNYTGFKSIEACQKNKCGTGAEASTAFVSTDCKSDARVAGFSC